MKWYLNENQVWETKLANGELVRWQGFPCGPICLTNEERAKLCEKLLQIDQKELKNLATESLQPVSQRIEKSLILHSTTPDLSAFKADLAKILENKQPKNYAGYTETRAVFLGKKGDLAVGRMLPWKIAAKKMELNMVEIPKTEYYYMSDALLKLAETHLEKPTPAIKKMVVFLQTFD